MCEFCVVYGVGICVNACGVVWVVVCVCFLHLGVFVVMQCSGCMGCCDCCLICEACNWRCSFMGSMSVCRVDVVHPVAILSAVFCVSVVC